MSVLYSQCLPGKCFTFKKKILFCARALPKGVHVSVAAKITVIAKGCTRFCVSTLPKGVQAIVQSYSWRGIPSFNVCDLLIQLNAVHVQMAEGIAHVIQSLLLWEPLKTSSLSTFCCYARYYWYSWYSPFFIQYMLLQSVPYLQLKMVKVLCVFLWGCQISCESHPGRARLLSRLLCVSFILLWGIWGEWQWLRKRILLA